ncbi:unnamed protein product [Pedinophyceae sp. YPF-701]|nr:unnamed protein product [Pedinophyceae sp. YPF-701]
MVRARRAAAADAARRVKKGLQCDVNDVEARPGPTGPQLPPLSSRVMVQTTDGAFWGRVTKFDDLMECFEVRYEAEGAWRGWHAADDVLDFDHAAGGARAAPQRGRTPSRRKEDTVKTPEHAPRPPAAEPVRAKRAPTLHTPTPARPVADRDEGAGTERRELPQRSTKDRAVGLILQTLSPDLRRPRPAAAPTPPTVPTRAAARGPGKRAREDADEPHAPRSSRKKPRGPEDTQASAPAAKLLGPGCGTCRRARRGCTACLRSRMAACLHDPSARPTPELVEAVLFAWVNKHLTGPKAAKLYDAVTHAAGCTAREAFARWRAGRLPAAFVEFVAAADDDFVARVLGGAAGLGAARAETAQPARAAEAAAHAPAPRPRQVRTGGKAGSAGTKKAAGRTGGGVPARNEAGAGTEVKVPAAGEQGGGSAANFVDVVLAVRAIMVKKAASFAKDGAKGKKYTEWLKDVRAELRKLSADERKEFKAVFEADGTLLEDCKGREVTNDYIAEKLQLVGVSLASKQRCEPPARGEKLRRFVEDATLARKLQATILKGGGDAMEQEAIARLMKSPVAAEGGDERCDGAAPPSPFGVSPLRHVSDSSAGHSADNDAAEFGVEVDAPSGPGNPASPPERKARSYAAVSGDALSPAAEPTPRTPPRRSASRADDDEVELSFGAGMQAAARPPATPGCTPPVSRGVRADSASPPVPVRAEPMQLPQLPLASVRAESSPLEVSHDEEDSHDGCLPTPRRARNDPPKADGAAAPAAAASPAVTHADPAGDVETPVPATQVDALQEDNNIARPSPPDPATHCAAPVQETARTPAAAPVPRCEPVEEPAQPPVQCNTVAAVPAWENPTWFDPRLKAAVQCVRNVLHASYAHCEETGLRERAGERAALQQHIHRVLEASSGGAVYIPGVPGTGKTVTVHDVARRALGQRVAGHALSGAICINCMAIGGSEARIYAALLEAAAKATPRKLLKWTQAPAEGPGRPSAAAMLQSLQEVLVPRRPGGVVAAGVADVRALSSPLLVVLDEADQLLSGDSQALQNLVMLAAQANSKLLLFAIANSIDLVERRMQRVRQGGFCPAVVTFQAYRHDEVARLLRARLENLPGPAFQPAAIDFVAKSVANYSGDMRRALDLAKRALDALVSHPGPRQGHQLVTLSHVSRAVAAQQAALAPATANIVRLPREWQLVLCAVANIALVYETPPGDSRPGAPGAAAGADAVARDISLGEAFDEFAALCASQPDILPPASQNEFCSIFTDMTATGGLVEFCKGARGRPTSVSLHFGRSSMAPSVGNLTRGLSVADSLGNGRRSSVAHGLAGPRSAGGGALDRRKIVRLVARPRDVLAALRTKDLFRRLLRV